MIQGDDITNLDALSVLVSAGNDLIIEHNPMLNDLDGLDNLTHINGVLRIWNNDIQEINGFNKLKEVDGQINIFQVQTELLRFPGTMMVAIANLK